MFGRNSFVLVAMAAMVGLIGSRAQSAVPSLLNYGGILTNGSGTPQVGTFGVTFAVYDAATGGAALWSEAQSVTTDSQGRFNVLLGTSVALSGGVFSDSARYLGITVSPDPEMTPRTRIATVGFAFRAATLDRAMLSEHNTFVGDNAGNSSMTEPSNTAIGSKALKSNTAGYANTASGAEALYYNDSGSYNTALGIQALRQNTEASSNTACGAYALEWNRGNFNTAVGVRALFDNGTGSNNTASGYDALSYNSTGYDNSAHGVSSLSFNATGYWNTATGHSALHFNSEGHSNTATGVRALESNSTGDYNTAAGLEALRSNTTGSNNTALGYFTDVSAGNLTNATAIGANAVVNASNKIRLGDANVTVIEGQVAYTFTSDKNAKENFREVNGDEVLQKLRDLDVQSWNYKGHDPEHFRHYGPVAQDFYAAFGHDGVGTSGTPTTINSGDMAGILMIAVQALEKRTAENDELKARVETLEKLVREQLAAVKGQ